MATKTVKSVKKSAKKTAAKPAAKAVGKVTKPAAKVGVKKTVKKAVKKAVAKVAPKAAPKAATKAAPKPAAKKSTAPKAASKKTAAKKPVVKAVVKKTVAKKAAVKKATAPKPVAPPVSLKGLRVSGAKAARIAQIVAESFLNKSAAEAKAKADAQAASAPASPAAAGVSGTGALEHGSALDAAHKAAAVLFAKKAEEVVLMDLRNLSTVADYYLIATCTNEPQMRAILGTVQRSLSRDGIKSLRSEYMPGVRWAVIDYGDLIVHLFEKQTRGFYSLERLWADAPSTVLKATDYALPADADETDADEDGDL